MPDTEKHPVEFIVDVSKTQPVQDDNAKLPDPGSRERTLAERRLVRKLDMRLLPTIFLIFIMNYIDRNGITTARLKGMQQDLHINDVQYATVIAILFASYCPAQVPSNMILNKAFYVHWHLYGLMGNNECTNWDHEELYRHHTLQNIYWTARGCVLSWGHLPFIPVVYKEDPRISTDRRIHIYCDIFQELAFRSAFLYAGLLVSNAFGSLMAAGILANMEGKLGIRAWRWLFFIEGAITTFVGFNAMWLLPDYPHNTRWLSPFDLRLAQVRLSEDAGEADKDNREDSQLQGLIMALKDPKVAVFSIMTISQLLGASFVQFFPTLTQTLGFSTTVTLLLAAPPWIVASILCCLNAWHADKTSERFFHLTAWSWGVILGFIISLSTMSLAARYISLFFMASGYAGYGLTLVWVANSIPRPPAKRAAAIAVVNAVGNLGTLIGSYTWKSSWGPRYHQSMAISLGALIISSLLSLLVRQMPVRENRKLDAHGKAAMENANRNRVEEAAKLEGITFEQAMERRKRYRFCTNIVTSTKVRLCYNLSIFVASTVPKYLEVMIDEAEA
ncbi:hypothetical protein HYPSUDRAFT_838942 [Hypholoma sublateritium FD-334 SS-4]|uniref:Major facilitator superfamily (MFS) profile domain-containing protein n=1 Tax=Hypholoma sublateritium (strain FD-334 SS-4) TaxID=945553 RepID=A0A0D2PJD2_HYPSF|nr:hypothetical protein HYPSUDRAFT_838942 [Hypholoma sublateritium FD-334 SS-4]